MCIVHLSMYPIVYVCFMCIIMFVYDGAVKNWTFSLELNFFSSESFTSYCFSASFFFFLTYYSRSLIMNNGVHPFGLYALHHVLYVN